MNRTDSEESPVEMTVETVSPTASDVGSMSDSPVRVPQQQKKKKRGLSFKKIRSNAQKLIPGRKNKDQQVPADEGVPSEAPPPPPSPPPTPTPLKEQKSTESLPAIKEEPPVATLPSTKSIDEIPGDRKVKKARKPSRAASFVKKLAGRKAKVAPNPPADDEASASTTETPLSIKRRTPEGANLSVSETSLYEGDKPSDSFKIEQLDSEPKVVRTISPKKTEMKMTLVNSTSTEDSPKVSSGDGGVQLPAASASLGSVSSSSASPSSSSSLSDKAKPGSVASVGASKTVATAADPPRAIPKGSETASSKPISATRPFTVVTTAIADNVAISSRKEVTKPTTISSLLSGEYIAEINRFSLEKVSSVDAPAKDTRERFFQPLLNKATGAVPPEPTNQDTTPVTPEINESAIKPVPAPPLQRQPSETTTGKLKNIFMKKDAQKKSTATTTTPEPTPTTAENPPPTTTVRTQEAAKPYQLGNNIKNPNLSTFKPEDDKPSTSGDTIVFNIGSQVRPDRTSSAKKAPSPSLLPRLSITEGSATTQPRSLEEYTSLEARGSLEDNSSPLSENSRRRIAYVAQPTLFTPEEEELVSGRPSLLSSSAASGEFSALESGEYLESGGKMAPHGDLLLEKGDNGVSIVRGFLSDG